MKKQILEALKAKFEGVSEAVLSRIADKLAKTVLKEEDVATAVEGVAFQTVLDSYGDSRATEASQSAVSNYEKKHGLKDGNKVQGGAPVASEPEGTDPGASGGNDLAKQIAVAVAAAVKPFQEEINTLKAGRVSETRKQQLDAILAKLPDDLRKGYGRISVSEMSDEDFADLISEVTAEVEGISTTLAAKGAVFAIPGNGDKTPPRTKEATDADIDELVRGM